MTQSTVRSKSIRVGIGVLVVVVTLGFLFAAPALAQDSGDIQVEIVDGPPESVAAGDDIDLTVEVENTGADAEERTVTLTVSRSQFDSETAGTRSIDLGANETERLNFSYQTTKRDLGSLNLDIGADGSEGITESVIVDLPEGVSFAAERTHSSQITLTLDAAEVGANGTVQEENVTLVPESGFDEPWNLAEGSENGLYQTEEQIVRGSQDSLINATVGIEGTDLSDTVHLHTVDQTTIAGWIGDGEVYIPVETGGVPDVDEVDVSLALSDGTHLDATFEDSTTVAVDLDDIRDATDAHTGVEGEFETDGAPIGSVDGLDPDIRYLHGEVVLWHPHIESGTEYEVQLEAIDGATVEHSRNVTTSRAGIVPVPEEGTVAGAGNVTLSVAETDGDAALLESLHIAEIAEEHSMEASVVDGETIESDRSFEKLSVSAVLIEVSGDDVMYLTGEEFAVDGGELKVPGADLGANHTLQVATDAGIVNVELESGDETSLTAFLIPGSILVFIATIGLVGGGVFGWQRGFPDLDLIESVATVVITVIIAGLFGALYIWESSIRGDFWPHHLAVFLLILSVVVGYTAGGTLLHRSTDEYGQTGTRTRQQRQTTATRQITVTDGSRPIKERVEIEAIDDSSQPPQTRSSIISGGNGTVTFPTGNWKLQAKIETDGGEHASDPVRGKFSELGRSSPITLEIPLPDVSVSVRDANRDQPVPEASVRMVSGGDAETKQTDDEGGVTFDPSLDTDSVTLTVGHEKYEEVTIERTLGDGGLSETVSLEPRTGRLEVVSRIDGVETGGMDIRIEPDEPALERLHGEDASLDKTTDENGSFSSEEFIVGRYRATLVLPERFDRHFETSEAQASVGRRGETVTLDARFTWDLSDGQRERIRRIRSDLDDVTSKSGIDIAIPQYYASVVNSVLDAVESFPQEGHHFAELEVHPDEVADATIEAAADTVTTISDAMSTKRNLDLFTACSDMAAASVQWNGTFDTGTLADRLRDDPMTARRSFAERADRVSQRIDSERGDLSEVAPTRELLERVEINDTKGDVDGVVSIHVAILVLDAIEELFDHRELRERLSRTVF